MTPSEASLWLLKDNRWQQNWVLLVPSLGVWRHFDKRPFALLVAVDAPLSVRYRRFTALHATCADPWNAFMAREDGESDGTIKRVDSGIDVAEFGAAHRNAHVLVSNPHDTIGEFHAALNSIQPPLWSPLRVRPSWDDYFMLLSDLAGMRSNCMKRRVGCVLVKSFRVIATGYNGTPHCGNLVLGGTRNCNEGGCDRCNLGEAKCGQGLSECLCLHAEENALLEAGRERIGNEAVLYCNTCPCLSCAKKICQAGVREVIYRQEYGMDSMSARLLGEAGVTLRQHRPLNALHLSAIFDAQ